MTSFNLPPGCSVSDLPGDTVEDSAWEEMYERLNMSGLRPEEICRRVFSPYWNRKPKCKDAKRIWP